MPDAQKIGFKFVCTSETQLECFRRKLFGVTYRQWAKVMEVKKGTILFLYNFETDDLIGPFTAVTDAGLNIEPEAWEGKFPSQVRVGWGELHMIKGASGDFPWIAEKSFEVPEELTQRLVTKLEESPIFKYYEPLVLLEQDIRYGRMFGEFLDKHSALSQKPAYPSDRLRIKAKKPSFIVFSRLRGPFFVEVKPTVTLQGMPELAVGVEDVERLKQLELLTGIKTFVVFPIDSSGLEWGALTLAVLWAKGARKVIADREYLVLPVGTLEKEGKLLLKELLADL